MTDKQYLEAITDVLEESYIHQTDSTWDSYQSVIVETERRLAALKAQEDNIKSDMWKEKKMSTEISGNPLAPMPGESDHGTHIPAGA